MRHPPVPERPYHQPRPETQTSKAGIEMRRETQQQCTDTGHVRRPRPQSESCWGWRGARTQTAPTRCRHSPGRQCCGSPAALNTRLVSSAADSEPRRHTVDTPAKSSIVGAECACCAGPFDLGLAGRAVILRHEHRMSCRVPEQQIRTQAKSGTETHTRTAVESPTFATCSTTVSPTRTSAHSVAVVPANANSCQRLPLERV
jgi:hypothetical protein